MAKYAAKEIVIELAGSKNQQFIFDSLGTKLRGRWSATNVRETSSNTQFASMPDIPGMHVRLNFKDRTLIAEDPLGWPDNVDLLGKINSIASPWFGRMRPADTVVKRNMTDTEIKSAVYEIVQRIAGGDARVVFGEPPALEEVISMQGDLRLRYGTMPIVNPVTGERQSPYASQEELQQLGGLRDSEPETIRPGVEV